MSLDSSKTKSSTNTPISNNADDIFPLKYVFYSILFVVGFLAVVFLAVKFDS